ncbi:MAG: ribosome small subunit-dependent GTPase A [Gammaproteobacteria bacterium]|nr:ribosome small subunit-dependent GTPase A [Gammaproteobacteria bacterium]
MSHSNIATVIASYGQRGILLHDGQELRYIRKGRQLRPVCGDRVRWEASGTPDEVLVTAIQERENQLQRPDTRGKTETLAANLATLAIVIAAEPKPDFYIADRFICAAELMGASPLVVWNKADLAANDPDALSAYESLAYPVIRTSATHGNGIAELEALLSDGFGMLVGQSGVGKSSLINCLIADADIATGELSQATGEGRHTTTASMAHRLRSGGMLIDSPGIRDFAPVVNESAEIQNGFREVVAAAENCRFANCSHLREPGCAVRDAVDSGDITERRYESYRRMCNLSAQLADKLKPG